MEISLALLLGRDDVVAVDQALHLVIVLDHGLEHCCRPGDVVQEVKTKVRMRFKSDRLVEEPRRQVMIFFLQSLERPQRVDDGLVGVLWRINLQVLPGNQLLVKYPVEDLLL